MTGSHPAALSKCAKSRAPAGSHARDARHDQLIAIAAHRDVAGRDVGAERDLALGERFVSVAHGNCCVLAGVAMLRETDGRREADIHGSTRRQAHVLDLNIMRRFFVAEADSVHRQMAIAECLQCLFANPRTANSHCVLAAVA